MLDKSVYTESNWMLLLSKDSAAWSMKDIKLLTVYSGYDFHIEARGTTLLQTTVIVKMLYEHLSMTMICTLNGNIDFTFMFF